MTAWAFRLPASCRCTPARPRGTPAPPQPNASARVGASCWREPHPPPPTPGHIPSLVAAEYSTACLPPPSIQGGRIHFRYTQWTESLHCKHHILKHLTFAPLPSPARTSEHLAGFVGLKKKITGLQRASEYAEHPESCFCSSIIQPHSGSDQS